MKFYLDTSVWGGYWDEKFKEETRVLFDYMKESGIEVVYSDVTEKELKKAPKKVENLLKELDGIRKTYIGISDEERKLASSYLKEAKLSKKCENDALHIAAASIYQVDVLIS